MDMEMNKAELLRQITAVDFTIIDLHLYLNTHPMDQVALSQYNSFVMQCKMLKEKYESLCGMLCETGDRSSYPWQWIDEPWPWEYSANFEIWGEEK